MARLGEGLSRIARSVGQDEDDRGTRAGGAERRRGPRGPFPAVLALTLLALTPAAAGAASTPLFGFNDGPVYAGETPAAADVAAAEAAAGAEVQRVMVSWTTVQPRGDQEPDFSRYRAFVDALEASGVRPLIVIGQAPRWTWAPLSTLCLTHCHVPPGPGHLDEWRDFAAAVAREFPEAAAFEIWNEPNSRGYWETITGPDPRRYGELYLWARRGIAEVAPGTPVLTGGLVAFGADVPLFQQTISTFLTGAYRSGGLREMGAGDAIGVHAYPATEEAIDSSLAEARSVLAARDPGRAIAVTETGISSYEAGVSEQLQAEALVDAYRRLAAEPDVSAVVLHRFRDQPGAPSWDAESGFGVVDADLTPKPAYCELARARSMPAPGGCG